MDDVKAGRFISLVLRHHPEVAGLTLDSDGYEFYISENGVWLTKEVPAKYIKRL